MEIKNNSNNKKAKNKINDKLRSIVLYFWL